ncbi:MAG TPA: DUF6167 family protein [Actinomycetes bacterium]|nr:DUF6167 family protein [Actinomycetes bacterium]
MRRLFWVAVGAAAGVYAVRKAQQTLHAYSPGGLAERATGVGASWQAFTDDVRRNAAEREAQLREALGMEPADPVAPLTPAEAADLTEHPASLDSGPRTSRPTPPTSPESPESPTRSTRSRST